MIVKGEVVNFSIVSSPSLSGGTDRLNLIPTGIDARYLVSNRLFLYYSGEKDQNKDDILEAFDINDGDYIYIEQPTIGPPTALVPVSDGGGTDSALFQVIRSPHGVVALSGSVTAFPSSLDTRVAVNYNFRVLEFLVSLVDGNFDLPATIFDIRRGDLRNFYNFGRLPATTAYKVTSPGRTDSDAVVQTIPPGFQVEEEVQEGVLHVSEVGIEPYVSARIATGDDPTLPDQQQVIKGVVYDIDLNNVRSNPAVEAGGVSWFLQGSLERGPMEHTVVLVRNLGRSME